MRIEEHGYNMITDEQGIKWLLKKLYDAGWRYIVADNYDNIYLTNEKPIMFDDGDGLRISSCEKCIGATGFITILPKLKPNEVFSMEEELGIVDWSRVKVDTPVLVSFDGKNWYNRYFASFDGVNVMAWKYGATSWSVDDDVDEVYRCKYAKLAEV